MTINIPLDSDLAGLLQMFDRPLKDTARELIVLELYRQGKISSGKAAELVGCRESRSFNTPPPWASPFST